MRSSINRTKEELEEELIELRRRAAELEVERKQVVEILRESEEKYRRVAENCTIGTAMTHGDRIIYMNEAGCRILGCEEESLIGRSILDLVTPEDRPFLRERVERKLRGDKIPTHYTIRGMRKDNTELLIEVSSSAPFPYKGKAAILAVFRDVTERQKRERDLLKTQKLESIGTLAGGIAHDFNNILMAILGNISLARMYTDLNSIFARLADAEKACLQAQDLTKQLLTFAKGGAPVKKAISIVELLKDSVTFALRGSNVRREFSITDNLWMAEIDIEQIEQVINNLIVNARQAMPEGGTVKIRAENVTVGIKDTLPLKDGEYVKISIQDQGIGIPEGHLQRIFDPYFSTKQQGSGLGLSTSYSIIKNHEGYIDVESQLGLGTTFNIYIPACPDGVLTKEEPAKEEKAAKKTVEIKRRILVMDDEDFIRELITEILNHLGHEVTTAADGAEAIELYKNASASSRPFDVVITDLTIPGGMGGKETIQALVEIDPEVKAIVSSGYSNDPIMSDFKRYGFKNVITKPYRIDELNEVLQEVLRDTSE